MAVKFHRHHSPRAIVDMVPMIDIVFQLVIFFMVATTFKTTSGKQIELPKSSVVSEIKETPLKITIVSENEIYIEDFKTNYQGLDATMEERVNKITKRQSGVVIYANKTTNYQLLIDVMDILNRHGFTSIDLATSIKKVN